MARKTFICCAPAVFLVGCATVHYGRMAPVAEEERTAYDCPAIAIEVAKCDAFLRQVYSQWSNEKGRRFWGFVGDLGIGDRREKADAVQSALDRRFKFEEFARAKSCPQLPAVPEDD
jgi:hypothetical protein